MTWDITDNNYDALHIKFNNGWQEFYLPKFRIYMEVEEPLLYIYWTDTEKSPENLTRPLVIDYSEVSGGYSDAAEVKAVIEGMILSPWGYTVVSISTADSPYTVTPTSGEVIYNVDTTAGDVTMNMPTAVGNKAKYTIANRAGNKVDITPFGAETINGAALYQLNGIVNEAVGVFSDNVNLFTR